MCLLPCFTTEVDLYSQLAVVAGVALLPLVITCWATVALQAVVLAGLCYLLSLLLYTALATTWTGVDDGGYHYRTTATGERHVV